MLRNLSLLLAAAALAACIIPAGTQPTPQVSGPIGLALTPGASPNAVPQPSANGLSVSPVPADSLDNPARIDAARPAVRDLVALAQAFGSGETLPIVARTRPLAVKVGDVETFWVNNPTTNANDQVRAKLRYVGPTLLMYVDLMLDSRVDQGDLEHVVKQFEGHIYPRDRQLFGAEWSPGVDGDTRVTILNTLTQGSVAGYFATTNEMVKAVNRFSNEREMIIMTINSSNAFGTDVYQSTLAHELQHMIHWHQQRHSPTWFQEGMSTLAQDLNGYFEDGFANDYLQQPDLQLTGWSSPFAPHYGAAMLFLSYFQAHYAGEGGLRELIETDAGNQLEMFAQIAARKQPDIQTFAQLYADWAVANVLNDTAVADGRYAYKLLPHLAARSPVKSGAATQSVSQFGVDYYGLNGPLTLAFDGADTIGLTSGRPKDGRAMWWSNRGDVSVATLSRAFDLTGVRKATLHFSTWYELELNYDYAFATISTDGGAHWATLKGETTTDDDPQGFNYGNGLTGVSDAPGAETGTTTRPQWVEERMDLSPYVGKNVLLRFWVINDDAMNAEGLLLDNIRIPELDYQDGAERGDGGWQAQGFVRTTGVLPQTWEIRLIRSSGGHTTVETVATDGQGRANIQLGTTEIGVLAVIGTTHFSTEPAEYQYTVTIP